jgi:Flp pilus assembly protein TadD
MTHEHDSPTQCDDTAMSSVLQSMQDTDDIALTALNETLAAWPRDYRLWFLRGAVYAGQQRPAEARTDFVQALTLAPEFHVARFMLGLLELINRDLAQAAETWLPLDRLAEDDALRALKEGLLSLGRDQFDVARDQLNRGLALNQQYPLINHYVRAVVEKISAQQEAASTTVNSTTEHDHHLLLSGYQGNQTRH